MGFFARRSLSVQFILLLAIALVVSQALTLTFIVGERRATARSSQYADIIDAFVAAVDDFDRTEFRGAPILLRQNDGRIGSIVMSSNNRSATVEDASPSPRYEKRLRRRLSKIGVAPLTVSVVRRTIDGDTMPPPPRDGFSGQRPGGRTPNGRGPSNAPRRPNRERPSLRDGAAGSGGFHPRGPPDSSTRPAPGLEEVVMSAQLSENMWVNATTPHYPTETLTSRAVIVTALTLLAAIMGVALMARRIVKPIRDLGIAADRLGKGERTDAVPENGPPDVRSAVRAFNQMQERLTRLLQTQRATLRAVGHDLKTPLTSLRIRAEDLPEEHGRSKFIATLDDLSVMTDEILSWAKDTAANEREATVDMSSLISSIADDFADRGCDVTFDDHAILVQLRCRRVALRRAIVNLVDNALKYGVRARLSLSRDEDHLRIIVDDDGAGIPEDQMEEVFQPFKRLEESRSKETGGVGLGLSIAQSIVHMHGGSLCLQNLSEGGLRATIRLPYSA